jgi:hypothetical protein
MRFVVGNMTSKLYGVEEGGTFGNTNKLFE